MTLRNELGTKQEIRNLPLLLRGRSSLLLHKAFRIYDRDSVREHQHLVGKDC